MAAKRAQSVKQNSATESSDNIEIYVPEAQTRLWEKRNEETGPQLTHVERGKNEREREYKSEKTFERFTDLL